MISLMKYTYLMDLDGVESELDELWRKYLSIINDEDSDWEKVNEARSILYLTGQIYCEKIAVEAIERRLHLLSVKLSLVEFLSLVDKNSEKLKDLREDDLFRILESFYKIIKKYKNKYEGGKYYLEEEKFIKKYEKMNPDKSLRVGYKGSFS